MSNPRPFVPPAPIRSPGKPAASAVARARRMRKTPTAAERLLWDALSKLDLGIQRQVPIGAYIADFASHPARLVIELDRPNDLADPKKLKTRAAWLRGAGYRIVRFPEAEVAGDIDAVVARIKTEAATPSKLANVSVPQIGGQAE